MGTQHSKQDHSDSTKLSDLSLEYTFEDLRIATDDFDARNKLGAGAAGTVFRGSIRGGTEVAIKVLVDREGGLNGFEDELRVLSRFRHPNLVTLLGWGRNEEDACTRYLVYELLPGGDVERRLSRCKSGQQPFPWQQRLRVALDAACGLSYMMNREPKSFHRDIKPPNILLDANGTAKMADFGLSSIIQKAGHTHLTVEDISGTPGYACPGYIKSGKVTEQSEVYSFGTVLLELLMNERPAIAGPAAGQILYPLVQLILPAAPGALERIMGRLDPTALWEQPFAEEFARLALQCIDPRPEKRPLFETVVAELRRLAMMTGAGGGGQAPAAAAAALNGHAVPAQLPLPVQPPPQLPPPPPPQQPQQMAQQQQPQPQQQILPWPCAAPVREAASPLLAQARSTPSAAQHGSPWAPTPPNWNGAMPAGYAPGLGAAREGDAVAAAGTPWRGQYNGGGSSATNYVGQSPDACDKSSETYVPSFERRGQRKSSKELPAELVLECVHADSLDLANLSRVQRALAFSLAPAGEALLRATVGRQFQPDFFETLVPRRECLACISRAHFELSWDLGSKGPSLQKLSGNALLIDDRPLRAEEIVVLHDGSKVSFSNKASANPKFLVLQVRLRSRRVLATEGAHPAALLAPTDRRHTAGQVSAPYDELPPRAARAADSGAAPAVVLECIHSVGADIGSAPITSRSILLPCDQALEVGKRHQLGFFEHLLKGQPQWLGFLSRTHCKVTLQTQSKLSLQIENLSANVIFVDGVPLGRGHCGTILSGGTLDFVAKPSTDDTETKFLTFTLSRAKRPSIGGREPSPRVT